MGIRSSPNAYPAMIALMRSGKVDLSPLVTHVYPLESVGEALAALESARRSGRSWSCDHGPRRASPHLDVRIQRMYLHRGGGKVAASAPPVFTRPRRATASTMLRTMSNLPIRRVSCVPSEVPPGVASRHSSEGF